jgi:peptidoglycan/xylan/chitin deacetylase (PgdA/CDA1 family)/tetratricopeptide (TPR) repeat protein
MTKQVRKYLLWAMGLLLCVSAAASEQTVEQSVADIVTAYRQIIVLFADEQQVSDQEQERAFVVGQMLYHNNIERLQSFQEGLEADLEAAQSAKDFLIEHFLEYLEHDPELWDADKLVFRALLEGLADDLTQEKYHSARHQILKKRVQDDLEGLNQIQKKYDQEIERIFSRFDPRGIEPRRESWDQYVKFLKSKFDRTTILREYEKHGELLPEYRGEEQAEKADSPEIFGRSFPENTVALTFDDGPHPKYTEKILEILNTYGIKSVFFEIGQQVGKVDAQEAIKLTRSAKASEKIIESGSVIGNHTYSHPALPDLKEEAVSGELTKADTLIKKVAGADPVLFRPPYGARNASVLAQVKAQNLRSVMWNIDSRDWADPIPKSVANRVLKTLAEEKRGIILFHDIQPHTIETLPLVLDQLNTLGSRFAFWNGQEFVVAESVTKQKPPIAPLYRESWAVVIGIDDYASWPKLRYAVNDAKGVQDVLVNKLGFKTENVFTVFNAEATRKNILSLFHDKLADPALVQKDDRVFIFYAGHGATRKLASGRELGYIIPVEADNAHFYADAISMTDISDVAEAIPAKHLFWVMDSCYSGLALVRGGGNVDSRNYIQETSRRLARQMLTAGGADQQVADSGPNGHSVFTWVFLQSLQGEGDLNKDGYITASELAAHLGPVVSSISLQTPAFGNLIGSEGGDFIFALERQPEFLSELSDQLDDQALRLQAQIDKMRDEITQKRDRNLKLKEELSAVKKQLEDVAQESATKPASITQLTPAQLNQQGLQLYKEQKYTEAADKFLAAANLDPTYAEAMNNVGYLYFKIEQYDKAVFWLKKVIALDPNRSVAWLNLGDSYFKSSRYLEAHEAYREYLRLSPNSRVTNEVKAKMHLIEASEEQAFPARF